jgi:hypothetical protein
VEKVNAQEVFLYPNALNVQRCNYIKYGERTIPSVLTGKGSGHFTNSVWLQLEKPDRRFTYHVEDLVPSKIKLSNKLINSRPYTIHLNVIHDANSIDILDSYYFGRLLDLQL